MTRRDDADKCADTNCHLPGGWVKVRRCDDPTRRWHAALPSDKGKRWCWHHGPATDREEVQRRKWRPHPNRRIQLAVTVLKRIAVPVTAALEEIHDELSALGFPSSSSASRERVSGGDADDRTEAAGIRVAQLTGWREDLRDDLHDLDRIVAHIARIVAYVNGTTPAAEGEPLCGDKAQEREGWQFWADIGCTELPASRGLCSRHYQAERRWRAANDLPLRGEPAA